MADFEIIFFCFIIRGTNAGNFLNEEKIALVKEH